MAITDLQISEELMTNAPSIKYRGDEGPKSPEEERMMMVDDILDEAYEQYVYDLLEQRPDATPMSKEEFRRMVIFEGMMGGGQPLPEDPTKPVNPFQPKPIGPVLPDKRQMAAFGGIMGMDGRRKYGIGSFFQKLKDKVVDDLIPNEIKDNPLATAALLAGGYDLTRGDDSVLKGIFKGIPEFITGGEDKPNIIKRVLDTKTKEGKSTIGGDILSGIATNIVPIVGGLTAGLFTKNQPEQKGLPSDTTALQLADLKKSANLLNQKQGLAANLNFLPAVAARQFTPEEMAITYAQAANGGRIGFDMGGDVSDRAQKYLEYVKEMESMGVEPMSVEEFNKMLDGMKENMAGGGRIGRAEGGIMDLGGLEKDYRNTGGFVEIGAKEKADDVPARLSVNEFVFTADAVRNAGGGDIDEGAKIMENVMKHLEGGGRLSRESQGMGGAKDMFAVSERLSEVV